MYHVIVNPASKTGKGKKLWAELEPVLVDKGVDYKVVFSKKAGHVIKLVRDLAGYTLAQSPDAVLNLIVLGGDGTLNETLQGISDFSKVRIGYIPTGSSNDMARDLGLSTDPVICLNNILSCTHPTLMDIGCVKYNNSSSELSRSHEEELMTQRYFGVSCGIGYDAAVCEEALSSPIKKSLNRIGLGKLAYLFIALKQLLGTKEHSAVITLKNDKKVMLPNFLFAAAMIHQFEGGGFKFCPNADYHDGLLDIIAVSGVSKALVLRALPQAMKGNHFKYKGIERYLAKELKIETSVPCWVHTDGEVTMKSNSITITCAKEKIQILK